MSRLPEGNAAVYCQGAFNTPNGKTAHGLVRFTKRYQVLSVIDSRYAGQDAGVVLDGKAKHIPILADIGQALGSARPGQIQATHLVMGLAPDGGRLSASAREDVKRAIRLGLSIDSGLHDFLSEDREISQLAAKMGVGIRDVRKPPPRDQLHFFSGKIEQVTSLKVAVLGTDSAVGKRTTAWMLVQALQDNDYRAEMIGTGQTAWMQGASYCIILDSLINDFVSGEIEHVVWRAWKEARPDVIVIEGQGSLMNPAYPGGFEILAAGRPDIVVLQHAPARKDYDGFPGYRIHPLKKQIEVIELLSGKPVVAVTVNHEGIRPADIPTVCRDVQKRAGLPAFDVLYSGAKGLLEALLPYIGEKRGSFKPDSEGT
jgi:uncharacterized NAD-dependent epimerase/dehydratase family protein